MNSLINFWTWLSENSDAFLSVVSIGAIILAYYTARKSPKWQYEAEYKLLIIKDIFPELLTDIRVTITNYQKYLEGNERDTFEFFKELKRLFETGQIEYVKKIDKKLYDNLYIINSDTIPLIEDLQKERTDFIHRLINTLRDYMDSLPLTILLSHTEEYATELCSNSIHALWHQSYEDIDKIRTNANDIIERWIAQGKIIETPSEPFIEAIITIMKNEVHQVKRNIDTIDANIENVINRKIIPSLEKHISDPF